MTLIELIKGMNYIVKQHGEKLELFFERYIHPAYHDAKMVYMDLLVVLSNVEESVQEKNMSVEDAVVQLRKVRIPQQAVREELRSRITVIPRDNRLTEDLGMFAVGICGVLQGGMIGRCQENNEYTMNAYLQDTPNAEELLFYEGNHTLLDLVDRFDKNSMGYIGLENRNLNEKKIKDEFLKCISNQKKSIENYWKVTTLAYFKIKNKVDKAKQPD